MPEFLSPEQPGTQRPLDDLMLAMDVVDTLRHRASLVERELDSDERDRQLIERLRAIYAAQGIEVPDNVLAEGVTALKEDRFRYSPPSPGLEVRLAQMYASRRKWGKTLLTVVALLAAAWLAFALLVSLPRARRLQELPRQLVAQAEAITAESKTADATSRAQQLSQAGLASLREGDTEAAQRSLEQLKSLRSDLEAEYELRIVARGSTGIWRVPDQNTAARNYYIIVQAVTPHGDILTLPITNEEDRQVHRVNKWGLRVDEETFRKIADDKNDDGIIQNDRFGAKRLGYLKPEYLMPTSSDAITDW